jgi:hypothetical protein
VTALPGTRPGAVAYGNSHQAVFIRGTDNRVYWKHSNDCGAPARPASKIRHNRVTSSVTAT